ncbi:MAG: DUF192 domain-containing protein [Syntrophothermus sp.]|uniref:DUF192 domain-containing protein n=1 Tax=Syntrophothermus sp. TaxID=2736299 RepID=UPI00257FB6AB|nr:DUF192 domain-containing protein [Syntrophothermus sp.]NSW83225.1 DUF192 domain-containing protein [Syntrophothermus sp.]
MLVINLTRNQVLAERAVYAGTFWSRFRGWMGNKTAEFGEALLLDPCRSVHTFWMRFPIDVVFVSADGLVVHVIEKMEPFRFSPVVRRAKLVIELPPGVVSRTGTRAGDRLMLQNSGGIFL